jgi:hypothetical protein
VQTLGEDRVAKPAMRASGARIRSTISAGASEPDWQSWFRTKLMSKAFELAARELRRTCDPASLGFETTADLPPLSEVLGQPPPVTGLTFRRTRC